MGRNPIKVINLTHDTEAGVTVYVSSNQSQQDVKSQFLELLYRSDVTMPDLLFIMQKTTEVIKKMTGNET